MSDETWTKHKNLAGVTKMLFKSTRFLLERKQPQIAINQGSPWAGICQDFNQTFVHISPVIRSIQSNSSSV